MVKLLVGLGNPGPRYAETRHNAGFFVIDALAKRLGIDANKKGFEGLYGEGRVGTQRVVLLKPQTFMNLSGRSVAAAARWYKLPPEAITVIYDDLDLPLGRLRIRHGGGAGGHNGVRSVIEALGTQAFPRVRLGIDRPAPGWAVVDWVLAPFTEDERAVINGVVERAVAALETLIESGVEQAMNQYNVVD